MSSVVLLPSTYLGPVAHYARLLRYPQAVVERCDHYGKQTYRNRCLIAGPSGVQALTIPVEKAEVPKCAMHDVRISDHGNWRHLHWNALESAYRHTPFFDYYADDFRPFYERKWTFLFDFNQALMRTACELLDVPAPTFVTAEYVHPGAPLRVDSPAGTMFPDYEDARPLVDAKLPSEADAHFLARPYYQVFAARHGFLPNLSIVDLLFNMGPEGVLVLRDSWREGII